MLALLLGFCGHISWFCDLFSHFRLQLGAGLGAVALALTLLRHHQRAATFGILAAVSILPVLQLYRGPTTTADNDNAAPSLRIMLANVNTETGEPPLVLAEIMRQDPDIIVLEEVNREWLTALSPLAQRYPHRVAEPRPDNFGIALYSRLPLEASAIEDIGGAGVPTITARLQLAGQPLTLVATHPLPPASHALAQARNEQLGALVVHLNQIEGDRLLIGDLNTTPWNIYFKQMLKISGLHDSSRGFGYQASWPVGLPLLGIPLDHCLHSDHIRINERRMGAPVGSDHRPLIIAMALVNGPA